MISLFKRINYKEHFVVFWFFSSNRFFISLCHPPSPFQELVMSSNSASAPLDLAAWDAEIKSKSADFEKLYQTMMKAQSELAVATDGKALEIWWRLAKATFMVTYNFIYEGEGYYEAIKNKADEASRYASKAIAIQANHFEANIWLAKSAAKVSQLELDAVKQIQ